jgi:hypothetical protein
VCPNPAHAGSYVTRAGWYGKEPHLRQRWWCHPRNGEKSHRFAEVLPRQTTSPDKPHYCVECSTRLEPWEGQAGAREYWFSALEVGHALALVANGESYRRAGQAARRRAKRLRDDLTGWGGRERDPNLDGQLVANWVDALTPLVVDGALPTEWPVRLAVDSGEFRICGAGKHAGKSFHVFVAVGYVKGAAKVWRMEAFPRNDAASWRAFFRRLNGHPRSVISDMNHSIRRAVADVFPDEPGKPATTQRLCELHVKRAIERALAPVIAQPTHPVMRALRIALYDSGNWNFFASQVRHTDAAAKPKLPAMMRWLKLHENDVAASVAHRTHMGPNSTGAVEAMLRKVAGAFEGRSQSFGNRQRMNKLLALMTLALNGQADDRVWADRLRERLHHRDGWGPGQRPHDDPKDEPSLVA